MIESIKYMNKIVNMGYSVIDILDEMVNYIKFNCEFEDNIKYWEIIICVINPTLMLCGNDIKNIEINKFNPMGMFPVLNKSRPIICNRSGGFGLSILEVSEQFALPPPRTPS